MTASALAPARLRPAAGPAVFGPGQANVGQVVDLAGRARRCRQRWPGLTGHAVGLDWSAAELDSAGR